MKAHLTEIALFLAAFLLVFFLSHRPEKAIATTDQHQASTHPRMEISAAEHPAAKEIKAETERQEITPSDRPILIHRATIAKMNFDLFDPAALTLRASVAEHYGLDVVQVETLNEELGKLFVDLRKLEANHAELTTNADGETFVRINPYPEARARAAAFVERVGEIFRDRKRGREFGRLLASHSTLGMLGEMTEDVSLVPYRTYPDGSKGYRVERIIMDENDEVYHSTSTWLRDATPVREGYEALFPQQPPESDP